MKDIKKKWKKKGTGLFILVFLLFMMGFVSTQADGLWKKYDNETVSPVKQNWSILTEGQLKLLYNNTDGSLNISRIYNLYGETHLNDTVTDSRICTQDNLICGNVSYVINYTETLSGDINGTNIWLNSLGVGTNDNDYALQIKEMFFFDTDRGYLGIGAKPISDNVPLYVVVSESIFPTTILFNNVGNKPWHYTLRSDSQTNGNILGSFYYDGNHDGGGNNRYAIQNAYQIDITEDAEEGAMSWEVSKAGVMTEIMRVIGDGLEVNENLQVDKNVTFGSSDFFFNKDLQRFGINTLYPFIVGEDIVAGEVSATTSGIHAVSSSGANFLSQGTSTGAIPQLSLMTGAGTGGVGSGGGVLRWYGQNSYLSTYTRGQLGVTRRSTALGNQEAGDWGMSFATSSGDSQATTKMFLTGDGTLLIGASNGDESKLNVIGNANTTGNQYVGGDLFVEGNITAKNVFLPAIIRNPSNRSQTVITANEWVNVTFDKKQTALQINIGHTWNDETNITHTINDGGIYFITYRFDFIDTDPNPNAHIGMRLANEDGTIIKGSYSEVDTYRQHEQVNHHHGFPTEFSDEEKFLLQFTSDVTTVSTEVHATFSTAGSSVQLSLQKISN